MTKHFICLSDSQWATIQELINWTPPPQRGVPRADFRKIWNSIFFVLTRGCRWVEIPKNPDLYCSKSTAHRWLIILKKAHVFDKVLSGLLQAGIAEQKIDLSQVAIDGSFFPQDLVEGKKLIMVIKEKAPSFISSQIKKGNHYGLLQPRQKEMRESKRWLC